MQHQKFYFIDAEKFGISMLVLATSTRSAKRKAFDHIVDSLAVSHAGPLDVLEAGRNGTLVIGLADAGDAPVNGDLFNRSTPENDNE